MTRYSSLIVVGSLVALLLVAPLSPAFAAGVTFAQSRSQINVGDSIILQVGVDTGGTPINAVMGKVRVPFERFKIRDVRPGESVVPLWVVSPHVNTEGEIEFSGGIPGGFTGTTAPLFVVSLEAIGAGEALITAGDVSLLQNDGQASALTGLVPARIVFQIRSARGAESKQELFPEDNTPPDPFTPLISRNSSIATNKYFVVFFARDKESGIDHYEVKEQPRFLPPFLGTEWSHAENPFVLKNQMWITDVYVRAYDGEGNVRESVVVKPFNSRIFLYGTLLILGIAALYRKKSRPAKNKRVK